MRILVTGGAGFIGHNISLYLINKGYEVLVLDTLERASPMGLERLKEKNIPIIKADVRFYENYSDIDVVVHAAAYVDVEESVREPHKYFDVNTMGTSKVGLECSKKGVKLIYLSSAAVYGDPVKIPITEADPIDPKSPYGLSKYMGEQIIRMYGRLYGLKYSILRLFNVYGPGQRMEHAGVVSKFVMNAIRGEPFIVYGDGTQTRDFIHVFDVARIVEKMISQDVFSNEIYNVGTGQPISILDLTGVISRIIGKDLVVIHKPRRKGDILHSVADISKLKHMISFEPAIHIEEGIKLLIEEYRSSSA